MNTILNICKAAKRAPRWPGQHGPLPLPERAHVADVVRKDNPRTSYAVFLYAFLEPYGA